MDHLERFPGQISEERALSHDSHLAQGFVTQRRVRVAGSCAFSLHPAYRSLVYRRVCLVTRFAPVPQLLDNLHGVYA